MFVPAAAETTLAFKRVAHQNRGPTADEFKWRALVTQRSGLRHYWERFNMRGEPPRIGFKRRVAVFAGTGGSSSCPPYVEDVRLRRAERRLVVRIVTGRAQGACTDDWVRSTFVLSIRRQDLPPVNDFHVRVRRIDQ